MDQAVTLRKMADSIQRKSNSVQKGNTMITKGPKGIAIASGKGGVGKTNIVGNLALSLSKQGKKVLVIDADVGLGNIHILLGLLPTCNLQHVISGEKRIQEVIVDGPGNIKILPTSSSGNGYKDLNQEEKLVLKGELESVSSSFDYVLFDIGAGISSNVLYFCTAAQNIMIVTTAEPTSFADAYAIMKVLSQEYSRREFSLVVNMAKNEKEGVTTFSKLSKVADRFNLNISIDYMGHIIQDSCVKRSVMTQKLFFDKFPESNASECIRSITDEIIAMDIGTDINWQKMF